MRSWAEERRTGTEAFLLSLPLSEGQFALAKFSSVYAVVLAAVALTSFVPISVLPMGDFDPGVVAAQYVGVLALGAAATAMGVFASSLAVNQASAYLGGTALLLAAALGGDAAAAFGLPGPAADFLKAATFSSRFASFARGAVDVGDLLFFVLVAAAFLYATSRVLLFRKWR